MPSTVNGTELSAQEFRDAFLLRYGRSPGDLPSLCDGCGQKFSVQHALECKKGGNVILRHNEIRDELADLAAKAIIPSAIRNEPLIHSSCPAVKMPELEPSDQPAGDVSIRGLWKRGTDCIINVRVIDTDAKSNTPRVISSKTPSRYWKLTNK